MSSKYLKLDYFSKKIRVNQKKNCKKILIAPTNFRSFPTITIQNDLDKIILLIKKYRIIDECYQKAQHYINLAANSLTIFKDSKQKEILKNLLLNFLTIFLGILG